MVGYPFPAPAAGAEGSPCVRGRPGRASEAQESEAPMQESGKHMQTTMTERDRGPARVVEFPVDVHFN